MTDFIETLTLRPPEARLAASGERPALAMCRVEPEVFNRLKAVLPAATKAKIQDTFGISETTWVKLRDGRAVKATTLARVMRRYAALARTGEALAAPDPGRS